MWSTLGGIAMATERLRVGTGVTCPILRIHPAIIAQAAATAASMFEGQILPRRRHGEDLNEHILAQRWPAADTRREMLEEAVTLMRELWRGELTTFRGGYFDVENARIYTLPDEQPEVYVAAGAIESATLAARIGDGLIGTAPDAELISAFEEDGGSRSRATARSPFAGPRRKPRRAAPLSSGGRTPR